MNCLISTLVLELAVVSCIVLLKVGVLQQWNGQPILPKAYIHVTQVEQDGTNAISFAAHGGSLKAVKWLVGMVWDWM